MPRNRPRVLRCRAPTGPVGSRSVIADARHRRRRLGRPRRRPASAHYAATSSTDVAADANHALWLLVRWEDTARPGRLHGVRRRPGSTAARSTAAELGLSAPRARRRVGRRGACPSSTCCCRRCRSSACRTASRMSKPGRGLRLLGPRAVRLLPGRDRAAALEPRPDPRRDRDRPRRRSSRATSCTTRGTSACTSATTSWSTRRSRVRRSRCARCSTARCASATPSTRSPETSSSSAGGSGLRRRAVTA